MLVYTCRIEPNIIQPPHFIGKVDGTQCQYLVKECFYESVPKTRHKVRSATAFSGGADQVQVMTLEWGRQQQVCWEYIGGSSSHFGMTTFELSHQ